MQRVPAHKLNVVLMKLCETDLNAHCMYVCVCVCANAVD